jgi:hypothetical protein
MDSLFTYRDEIEDILDYILKYLLMIISILIYFIIINKYFFCYCIYLLVKKKIFQKIKKK